MVLHSVEQKAARRERKSVVRKAGWRAEKLAATLAIRSVEPTVELMVEQSVGRSVLEWAAC